MKKWFLRIGLPVCTFAACTYGDARLLIWLTGLVHATWLKLAVFFGVGIITLIPIIVLVVLSIIGSERLSNWW